MYSLIVSEILLFLVSKNTLLKVGTGFNIYTYTFLIRTFFFKIKSYPTKLIITHCFYKVISLGLS